MLRLLAPLPLAFALSACGGSGDKLERPAPPPQPPEIAPVQSASLPVGGVLNVITVKNGDAEVPGQLTGIQGKVTLIDLEAWTGLDGTLSIDLGTWSSGVELRDDRIKETFFELATHPRVTFDLAGAKGVPAEGIPVGATDVPVTVDGKLALHGVSQDVQLALLVGRPAEKGFTLSSQTPLTIKVGAFGMTDQLEALRVLCAHESLSEEVRISLDLTLGKVPVPPSDPGPPEGKDEADG